MPITISNFHKGQSSSPYTTEGAFAKAQNLDVFSQPGIARINYLPVNYTAQTAPDAILDIPVSIVKAEDSFTTLYIGTQDDKVYFYTANDKKTEYKGVGGKFVTHWKSALLGAGTEAGNLKYWASGTTWTNLADGSTLGVGEHFLFKSSYDDILYVCNGLNIATVDEDTTFDPSNAATHTYTAAAFTLPAGYTSVSIADLNDKLVIAAIKIISVTPEEAIETALFIWDRASSQSDQILFIPESDMTTMFNVGNAIYITGGENGRIWRLSESGLEFFTQIPFDLDNDKKVKIGRFGHQSLAWWNNRLLVGVSSDDGLYPAGIYGVTLDKRICHEFLPSEGYDGSTKDVRIGAMCLIDENNLLFGWENSTDSTWGLDLVQTSGNRQVTYSSYLESIFYPMGTMFVKGNITRLEVQLSRPLQTGEGIRVKERRNIDDTWTTVGTKTFVTNGAHSSYYFGGIKSIENIQIRVELTTGASSKNTPYVMAVNLI